MLLVTCIPGVSGQGSKCSECASRHRLWRGARAGAGEGMAVTCRDGAFVQAETAGDQCAANGCRCGRGPKLLLMRRPPPRPPPCIRCLPR